ncbi:Gfo/Idh/MocA family protein [Kineococcus rhizosphaerae]|uniref:Myo-inositol 2-dehydrogenase/D-chiro-inositol 1-dehydrogenase n=1 Tax=Kineococcus rhizosphaerae TaxID=559628 RepID=A0A2T0R2N6_9ACTN|nr:Gfo/Idh/MocA family oxidoreductase [Kineococcus rhizosphaerae]PRY14040.1 myo-inositol 2-dehydrogenase/D-chiro-inositol 1-dehydrogenase [Kineococcus rhizosphaerae]
MSQPVRFALLGTGRIGQVHAASIHRSEDAVLTVAADAVVAGAERTVARYGGRATADPFAAIAADDVDAVVIASPTPTHVDLLSAALDAGKAVLCEKPIDLDITRVDAVRERARAAQQPVVLGFNRRFDPHFAELRRRVRAGEIGRLEHLAITSRDPEPPPAEYVAVSGGIFRDMTIHDFDTARSFVPEIVAVTAVGLRQFSEPIAAAGDFDAAVVTLVGSAGESVTITNSRHSAYGYDQRIEAFGPGGSLEVGNVTPTLVRASTGERSSTGEPYRRFFLERYREAYELELAAFVAAVRGEDTSANPSPGFEDGRAALLLADAADLSAREGRTVPVDLS